MFSDIWRFITHVYAYQIGYNENFGFMIIEKVRNYKVVLGKTFNANHELHDLADV